MDIEQRSNTEYTELRGWLATHNALAAGLWIGAPGIFLQAVTGAKGYPKVPPGIPARLARTAALGLLLVGLIWIGVFTASGTAYRLQRGFVIGIVTETFHKDDGAAR